MPFSLTYLDIVIPDHCPILGIKLERGTSYGLDTSPSLDRIVPKLGYVPGNVRVISNRANRIKSDSTPEELSRILTYVLENDPTKAKSRRRLHANFPAAHAALAAAPDVQPGQSNT
ncbi:hypothetical protein [Novosphingobium lindaniclasticum]|uniref:hypothetical protein n=1 Tax=Novosphingobium lindaniclasticum TaxID=1329895 RepID=UPI000415A6F2|nr:hypothetical protein [Novosphingobium lindaniclasticum]